MQWVIVWSVLVVATLAGATWLALRLYRQVRRFLAQLRDTTIVLERLEERIEELTELRGPDPAFTPDLAASPERRIRLRARIEENRARRRRRTQERRRRTLTRWQLERVVAARPDPRSRMNHTPSTQGGE
ncbi:MULTISPECIES: hypothetical protein [unclassified Pseudactinotalea]|uniref:hypothetical protein n=1 Tax=unclassified Pseudactinotalea TaxID=2649176 RepID=UPI00128E9350|nr:MULTISPECIES: hypothetical protein [unclassified Pseudactinotalea]MPV49311.1 hypothetical protein [Pseudactinotalea sp. HY160]QGH69394.1 hypothetical protein GCE65_07600 [Pseudactinotalea sp. HY158]